MSKIIPKISTPGSAVMPNTGGHTDGSQKGGHARGGALANPGRTVPKGPALGRSATAPTNNIVGTKIGQPNPDTGAASTKKPKTKAALAFYGE
jgi:hypothetical protein